MVPSPRQMFIQCFYSEILRQSWYQHHAPRPPNLWATETSVQISQPHKVAGGKKKQSEDSSFLATTQKVPVKLSFCCWWWWRYLLECMCSVHGCIQEHMHMCSHVCGGQMSMSSVVSQSLSTFIFCDRDSHWAWSSLIQPGWPTNFKDLLVSS